MDLYARTLYYEDLKVGDKVVSFGRTLTQADIVNFLGVARITAQIFSNKEYAKEVPFGKIVAPGPLTFTISIALFENLGLLEESMLAFLGIDELRFHAPVNIDDTIHVEAQVTSKRQTSKADRGVVVFRFETKNQNNQTVLVWYHTFLVRCKPTNREGPIPAGRE